MTVRFLAFLHGVIACLRRTIGRLAHVKRLTGQFHCSWKAAFALPPRLNTSPKARALVTHNMQCSAALLNKPNTDDMNEGCNVHWFVDNQKYNSLCSSQTTEQSTVCVTGHNLQRFTERMHHETKYGSNDSIEKNTTLLITIQEMIICRYMLWSYAQRTWKQSLIETLYARIGLSECSQKMNADRWKNERTMLVNPWHGFMYNNKYPFSTRAVLAFVGQLVRNAAVLLLIKN